jgi:hypothetical protein
MALRNFSISAAAISGVAWAVRSVLLRAGKAQVPQPGIHCLLGDSGCDGGCKTVEYPLLGCPQTAVAIYRTCRLASRFRLRGPPQVTSRRRRRDVVLAHRSISRLFLSSALAPIRIPPAAVPARAVGHDLSVSCNLLRQSGLLERLPLRVVAPRLLFQHAVCISPRPVGCPKALAGIRVPVLPFFRRHTR